MAAAALSALGVRYTKGGVLIFGFGIFLGVGVVAGEIGGIGRGGRGGMAVGLGVGPVGGGGGGGAGGGPALGLVRVPMGRVADGRGGAILRLHRRAKSRRAARRQRRRRPPARAARRQRR